MMMQIVFWIVGSVFSVAAVLSAYRIIRGPGILDRMIASDMLMTTLICVIGVQMAYTGRTTGIPIMLVLAVVGFLSSVAVARYVSKTPYEPQGRRQ